MFNVKGVVETGTITLERQVRGNHTGGRLNWSEGSSSDCTTTHATGRSISTPAKTKNAPSRSLPQRPR